MQILMVTAADSKGFTLAERLSHGHDVTVLHPGEVEIECPFKEIETNERELARFPLHDVQLIVYLASDRLPCRDLTAVLHSARQTPCVKCVCIAENPLNLSVQCEDPPERYICRGFQNQMPGELSFWSVSPLYGDDFLPEELMGTLAGRVRNNRIILPGFPDHTFDVMHVDDLAKAIERYAGEDRFEPEMNLTSGQHSTFKALGDALHGIARQANIDYTVDFTPAGQATEDGAIKGWMPERTFFSELPCVVRSIESEGAQILRISRSRVKSTLLRLLSFLALFAFVCLYTGFIKTSSELQFVDVRLLFIISACLFWGKRYGLAAAVLCSVASVAQSVLYGTQWYVIFFHVDNWIPVSIYLASSVLFGMYQERSAAA